MSVTEFLQLRMIISLFISKQTQAKVSDTELSSHLQTTFDLTSRKSQGKTWSKLLGPWL